MANEGIRSSLCNNCGHETEHDLITEETTWEMDYGDFISSKVTAVVRCRGCKEFAIRREEWWTDRTPDETNEGSKITSVTYFPDRIWRRAPSWMAQLEGLAPDLADILTEIYSATNERQYRLLAMGVRLAVDTVMTQRIGDIGTFDAKLAKMVQDGHLTEAQKEILATVIDVGSAAAHRGFKPPQDLLLEMVVITESMIRDYYITGPMMRTMRTVIPPRPPRTPRTP